MTEQHEGSAELKRSVDRLKWLGGRRPDRTSCRDKGGVVLDVALLSQRTAQNKANEAGVEGENKKPGGRRR